MMLEQVSGLVLTRPGEWALGVILAASFAGGFVKGVTTLGLALIAVPLISLFLDVQTAILSVFLSKFLSDIAMLAHSKKELSWRLSSRVSVFVVVGFASIPLATVLLSSAKGPLLYLLLAASILTFVAVQLKSGATVIRPEGDRRRSLGFGFAAGASQGLTGAAGPYAAMYLYGLGLVRNEFVFLSSVIYILFDLSQLAAILYNDLYDARRFLYAVLTIVPVMGGTYLGIGVRQKVNEQQFRALLLIILLVSAGALIFRAATV